MNKLTKIGVSALCGSLAAVSAANAGAISVAGGANATWTKLGYGTTGTPLGMSTYMTFTGSGELENGSSVTMNITHDDQNAFSSADVALTIPGMGTFKVDQGGGTGLDRIDDKMPTAWEETDGTGVGAGLVTLTGAGGGNDIEWAVDSGMLPDGMSAYVSYAPKADGKNANDKATGGDAGGNVDGKGWDIVVEHSGLGDGLNVFAGYSVIDQGAVTMSDRTAYGVGATYAVGPVTLGYQFTRDALNNPGGTDMYENNAYGITFNVSDDLSISYGNHESEKKSVSAGIGATVDATSIQAAYSMGGATLKIADTTVDNAAYDSTTASDRSGTTIMLSLAF